MCAKIFITNAYFQHALGESDLSTETRFVPRAFSAVNYKLVPFGTINSIAYSSRFDIQFVGLKTSAPSIA
jgi:hypothetical protein